MFGLGDASRVPPLKMTIFRGLYPRSWTCYDIRELGLTVVIRQISPVLPNNYEVSLELIIPASLVFIFLQLLR